LVSFQYGGEILGFRFWIWHQKLTVTLQTPSGFVAASSVSATSWDMPPRWFKIGDSGGWHGAGGSLLGEAVVLEVLPGRYLFALIGNPTSETTIQLFAEPPLKSDHPNEYARSLGQLSEIHGKKDLTKDAYPKLVIFDDINDPASSRIISPTELSAVLGTEVSLQSMSLSVTHEPVTEGRVDQALPWLCKYQFRLGGDRKYPHQIASSVVSPAQLKSDRCQWRNYVPELWGTDIDDKIMSSLCCPA
jgi:hypothetical protein